MTPKESVEQTSPSGESIAAGGDRGAFPLGEARFACFPTPDRAVLKVLS